jgi:AcrR family transcriptional regulator
VKEEIISTSLQQFLKHGIRKMTVQKLVAPMGISTKTVYKYFDDKEDLLNQCLVKHYSGLVKDFNLSGSNPVITILSIWHQAMELDFGVNHVFYHDLNYYHHKLQDSILQRFFKKRFSKLYDLMEKGIRQGYFRKDIVPAMIPEVTSALYASITRTDQFKKYKLTPGVLMQNTIEAYLRGVCTEKGLREINNYSLIVN